MKPTGERLKSGTSNIHRMGAGAFARELFRRFAPWWLWIGVALFVVGLVMGIAVDIRWAIVGFMVLLVLLPPALAISYYSHALCRECFVNTTPHTVSIEDDCLVVRLYGRDFESEKEEFIELRPEVFRREMVTGRSMDGEAVTIELRDRHRGFLWIPAREFDEQDFRNICEWAGKCSVTTNP